IGACTRLTMNFSLTDQQRELQDTARRFCQAELPAFANELEAGARPVPRAMMHRYAEMGFLSINTDADYGGLGLSHLDALIVLEEFAKLSVAVAFPVFECCTGPVRIVERYGSESL